MSTKNIKSGKVKAVAKTVASRTIATKTALVKTAARQTLTTVDEAGLLTDLRGLIAAARRRVATAANATHTMLCWHVGRRLLKENLDEGRAAYGRRILVTVSRELEAEFGDGFSYSALTRMVRFAESMTDEAIVVTLSQQLSWSHFHALLAIKDPLARDFYAEMCRIERDLETAILREIEDVLLELGTGFAFVARQKRMSVGKDDFHLDLLFYHRQLRRLIAVELKLESFQPAHAGQMEFYLRWLDKHERAAGEEAPIGLILCASADAEQVELLELDAKSIRVSEYLTELPPLKLLQARLHQAIEHAREHAARRIGKGRT